MSGAKTMPHARKRTAFLTGITGQDAGHLAQYLHDHGYSVWGMIRGQNNPRRAEVDRVLPFVHIVEGDLLDLGSIVRAINIADADELHNFAAISHVGYSFSHPSVTMDVTGKGVLNVLEAVRLTGREERTRVYQASTSEMFGGVDDEMPEAGYNETSPLHPRSPYGAAKAYGHWIARNYRESYGMFVVCGILFNHEGERRGTEFVTRKISRAVARISVGLQDDLHLGALWPRRDWGYAGDYVRGIHMMMQRDEPEDFVLATGMTHSVQDFVERAFAEVGIDDWRPYVVYDRTLERAAEVGHLFGDARRARDVLGWRPEVDFEGLVRLMVAHDLELARAEAATASIVPPTAVEASVDIPASEVA
jgi:GDPmannose 4,6-dehydratase